MRIARLVAMVCIALVWAYLVGEHKDINIKPIRILKHGRKAKSLVKYGLEEISTILMRQIIPQNSMFSNFCHLSSCSVIPASAFICLHLLFTSHCKAKAVRPY